jgi:hypothetical protein
LENFSVNKSLIEEAFWPEMSKRIKLKWHEEKELIRKFAKNQNIKRLTHFTIATNLQSIFQSGLNSRTTLKSMKINHQRLDQSEKIYFEDFIYVSLSSPNTKMMFSKYQLGVPIAIIILKVKILWKMPFFSLPMNSARSELIPLIRNDYSKLLGLKGLQNLFLNNELREKWQVHSSEPTDIQSELIFLDPIPQEFFETVLLTPIEKTSPEFLQIAKEFSFFNPGLFKKHNWKWLNEQDIASWGPKFSTKSQVAYNERNWNETWN